MPPAPSALKLEMVALRISPEVLREADRVAEELSERAVRGDKLLAEARGGGGIWTRSDVLRGAIVRGLEVLRREAEASERGSSRSRAKRPPR